MWEAHCGDQYFPEGKKAQFRTNELGNIRFQMSCLHKKTHTINKTPSKYCKQFLENYVGDR